MDGSHDKTPIQQVSDPGRPVPDTRPQVEVTPRIAPPPNPFLWYYGHGEEPEYYYGGYATRDEAVAEGQCNAADCGFTIVEANKDFVSADIFDTDLIVERLDLHNEESWGEDGMPSIDVPNDAWRELELALKATLETWLTKHNAWPTAWAFGTVRIREYFPPQPDNEPDV